MVKLFITVVSVSAAVLVLAAAAIMSAAAATNNDFATFDNPHFGIKIQYPPDWAREITDDELGKDVTFLVPGSPIKYGEKVSVMITNETSGRSLYKIVGDLIDFNQRESPAMVGANYKVVESVPVTVNGINAHRLVNTYHDSKFKDVKSMQVLMLRGDKLYTILYTAEPDKYETLLPTVQKMIDSFQFIPVPAGVQNNIIITAKPLFYSYN